jgi:hypothetical protein
VRPPKLGTHRLGDEVERGVARRFATLDAEQAQGPRLRRIDYNAVRPHSSLG